jgi:hypothetical protein
MEVGKMVDENRVIDNILGNKFERGLGVIKNKGERLRGRLKGYNEKYKAKFQKERDIMRVKADKTRAKLQHWKPIKTEEIDIEESD